MRLRRIDVVVCVIVAVVLFSLLLPAIQQSREAARRTQSRNNLKQIGLSLSNYHEAYLCLPPGGTFDADGRGYHGWMTYLLWYFDSNSVGHSIDWGVPWDSPRNAGHLLNDIGGFEIPGEEAKAGTWEFPLAHYSANAHLLAANSAVLFKDVGSKSSQFLAAELCGDFVPWACPYNFRPLATLNCEPPTYGHHVGVGCHFLYVDGHVEYISNEGFLVRRESLSGPDLAGFGRMPTRIIRPQEFTVPDSALKLVSIPLQSSNQSINAYRNRRGQIVRIESTDSNPKHGTSVLIHDEDLPLIVRHSKLREILLEGDFTDVSLYKTRVLNKLRKLHLKSDQITEAGLSVLNQLTQLKEVRVEGKQITNEIRDRLRKRFPECDIQPE